MSLVGRPSLASSSNAHGKRGPAVILTCAGVNPSTLMCAGGRLVAFINTAAVGKGDLEDKFRGWGARSV